MSLLLILFLKLLTFVYCFHGKRVKFEEKVHRLNNRDAGCQAFVPYSPPEHKHPIHSFWVSLLILLLLLLLILLLLGLIKGLLGLFCCAPVGMWGLGVLIDLPRSLDQYQEDEIKDREVIYDVIGWPIHPDTKERSVRALTKRCEFCLNLIFFLTYPLIMCVDVCTLCCFQTYDHEDDKDRCFESINTVAFTNCSGKRKRLFKKTKKGDVENVYNDEDSAEDADTQYVIQQMYKSEESLMIREYQ